jgi:capsular polysaccharide transport system permease protein
MNTTKTIFLRNPHWLACLLATLVMAFYWGLWASDRYVSEANVVLESPQIAAPKLDFQSLLSGSGASHADMLLLRDYLLSVDMLRQLDQALDFRGHYSAADIDRFSALNDPTAPIEELHEYYLDQVEVELDDYAGVLRIRVDAFTPEMAHAVAQFLLQRGEAHMNAMGQRLAEEQVAFLERQVGKLSEAYEQARQALIDYQNRNGLVSPTGTVESLNAVVANLEAQLANLRARRTALLSYQSERTADVRRVDAEINGLIQQIQQERARMAQQSGDALNVLSSQYQTLELKAQFARDSYSAALMALENTRIEAARKLKQVSVLQSPTLPEYPVEPRRLYNTVVFAIVMLFLALIMHMLILIIRDHRD